MSCTEWCFVVDGNFPVVVNGPRDDVCILALWLVHVWVRAIHAPADGGPEASFGEARARGEGLGATQKALSGDDPFSLRPNFWKNLGFLMSFFVLGGSFGRHEKGSSPESAFWVAPITGRMGRRFS